jgi:hypothetical protein
MIVDEACEIFLLDIKKHFISMRPYLSLLPVRFSDFSELSFLHVVDSNKKSGCLMAVGGIAYVTICLIEPIFEIAMVYDKEKHGGQIKKNGYANVSFREHPNSLMIIWDKYL